MLSNEAIGSQGKEDRWSSPYQLLLNATAATAGGLPRLLDSLAGANAGLASIARAAPPAQLGATGFFLYRPGPLVKMLQLTYLSDTGGNNETAVFDIFLYSALKFSGGSQFMVGKKHRCTLTLCALTETNQTVEPFTGTSLGGSKTLRYADTCAWNPRDTGDLQVFDKGFSADDLGAGTIYVDMTGHDMIGILLQTKPASSVRDMVGILEEAF
jgi:hypothetical protein